MRTGQFIPESMMVGEVVADDRVLQDLSIDIRYIDIVLDQRVDRPGDLVADLAGALAIFLHDAAHDGAACTWR